MNIFEVLLTLDSEIYCSFATSSRSLYVTPCSMKMFSVSLAVITIVMYSMNSNCEIEPPPPTTTTQSRLDPISSYSYAFVSLSAHYEKVLSDLKTKHANSMLYKTCADFYRLFFPYTEDRLINATLFSTEFILNNLRFANAMKAYIEGKNRQAYVDKIVLAPLGLQLTDRKSCYFDPIGKPSITTRPPQTSTKEKEINPAPSKCEKFLVFFNNLLDVPIGYGNIVDEDLIYWKRWLEHQQQSSNIPFPFLVQHILAAVYWANKFHHDVGQTTPLVDYVNRARTMYKCFKDFPPATSSFFVTDTWEPPAQQDYQKFTTPVKPANEITIPDVAEIDAIIKAAMNSK